MPWVDSADLVFGYLSAIEAAGARTNAIGLGARDLLSRRAGRTEFEVLDWAGPTISGGFGIVTRRRASLSAATRAFMEEVRVADAASVVGG